jgi:hypothetical protein
MVSNIDYPAYLPERSQTWAFEHNELMERIVEELLRTGAWPPLKELTRQLAREQRPVALRSLFWQMPKPLGFVENNPERVILTLFGLRVTRAGHKLLDGFVEILKLATQRYGGEDSAPVITHADVACCISGLETHLTALSELLLRGTPFLGSGSGSPEDEWVREVADDIVRYWDVASIDDYLCIRAAELSQSPQFGWPSPVPLIDDSRFAAAHPQSSIEPVNLSDPSIAGAARGSEASARESQPRDVFISHASEDKDTLARPLAETLLTRGHGVWFDEFELVLGDSLRRSIDRGLANSRFGVVILSPSFFAKEWPQRELDGLTSREVGEADKVILPVWHEVDREYIARFSPTLADKLAVLSKVGVPAIVEEIERALLRSRDNGSARSEDRLAPSIAQGDTVRGGSVTGDTILEHLIGNNEVGARESLRTGRAALEQKTRTLAEQHNSEPALKVEIVGLSRAMVSIVDQTLPLIRNRSLLLDEQARWLGRLASSRYVGWGVAAWVELPKWMAWCIS